METIEVSIRIPRDLVGALDIPLSGLAPYLQQVIALELFRQGHISSGKAAELMGIPKHEFMNLLGKRNAHYFSETPSELEHEVTVSERLLYDKG